MPYVFYKNKKFEKPITYAVKHNRDDVRRDSRSGGVFTAISDAILNDNGVVYGCVLDKEFKAIHVRAENYDDRNFMRGSKYIQSEMRDMFLHVKDDLEHGKNVLFSGTSCQISGLNGFLGREYANLLCVDIVCHGVPSPKVWEDYLSWQSERNGGKIVKVDFRNKRDFGWGDHVESLFFEDGKQINSRIFTTLFYGHAILRPCCYQCPYKDIIHPGNITIADYWGIDSASPGFNDNKGVSLVLVNDEKGKLFFKQITNDLFIRETKIENSIQPPLLAPFSAPHYRDKLWHDYNKFGFSHIARTYGGNNILAKAKRNIKKLIKR